MDMLVQTDPEKYGPNVVYEKLKKVLYIEVLKYIYVFLQQALLSYINLKNILRHMASNVTHITHVWITRSYKESH